MGGVPYDNPQPQKREPAGTPGRTEEPTPASRRRFSAIDRMARRERASWLPGPDPFREADWVRKPPLADPERSREAAPPEGVTPERVSAALARLEKSSHGWGHGLMVLGVSVAAFFFLGLLGSTGTGILLLIGVILVHELGHYAGMRVFGYRNVRMFFIPLFGAAVSGRNVTAPGWQKAAVSLLGPVPGILVGFTLALLYFRQPSQLLGQAALLFISLNAFNLLPLLPLDGGHFLDRVLFCRSRYLEAAFRAVAGAGLAFGGYSLLDSYVLAFLGVIVALSARHAFRLATVAAEVGGDISLHEAPVSESVPPEIVRTIMAKARRRFPLARRPRDVAKQVKEVWERLNARPPRALASVGLLALYAVCVLSVAIVPIVLLIESTDTRIVAYEKPDGTTGRKEVRYLLGRLIAETELGDNGLYHGRGVSYHFATDEVAKEGSWFEGRWHGEWKAYDWNGAVTNITVFDKGEFVVRRDSTETGWVEKKLDEVPLYRQVMELHNANAPHGPPEGLLTQ